MQRWSVSGSYFEACNCDPICPCRKQGGVKPPRGPDYVQCDFALSWRITAGRADDLDLAGLSVVMAGSYRADEQGMPWRVSLYVDETASSAQYEALQQIFLGRAGGTVLRNFGTRIRDVYAVRRAKIALDHAPRRWFMRAGDFVEVRASEIVTSQQPVTCGIPGHDRAGEELRAEVMRVTDPPLSYEVQGRCGFETDFDYRSDAAGTPA